MRSKFSYVRSSHDLCARAHAHSLAGMLATTHPLETLNSLIEFSMANEKVTYLRDEYFVQSIRSTLQALAE